MVMSAASATFFTMLVVMMLATSATFFTMFVVMMSTATATPFAMLVVMMSATTAATFAMFVIVVATTATTFARHHVERTLNFFVACLTSLFHLAFVVESFTSQGVV